MNKLQVNDLHIPSTKGKNDKKKESDSTTFSQFFQQQMTIKKTADFEQLSDNQPTSETEGKIRLDDSIQNSENTNFVSVPASVPKEENIQATSDWTHIPFQAERQVEQMQRTDGIKEESQGLEKKQPLDSQPFLSFSQSEPKGKNSLNVFQENQQPTEGNLQMPSDYSLNKRTNEESKKGQLVSTINLGEKSLPESGSTQEFTSKEKDQWPFRLSVDLETNKIQMNTNQSKVGQENKDERNLLSVSRTILPVSPIFTAVLQNLESTTHQKIQPLMVDQSSETRLVQNMVEMSTKNHPEGLHEVTVQLKPETMGQVIIQMKVSKDQVDLLFKLQTPQTRELFEGVAKQFIQTMETLSHRGVQEKIPIIPQFSVREPEKTPENSAINSPHMQQMLMDFTSNHEGQKRFQNQSIPINRGKNFLENLEKSSENDLSVEQLKKGNVSLLV